MTSMYHFFRESAPINFWMSPASTGCNSTRQTGHWFDLFQNFLDSFGACPYKFKSCFFLFI